MSGPLPGATAGCMGARVWRVVYGEEHPPPVEWPEGISFMKSDNIQATPSSLFYKSSLTLINELATEGGRSGKSCGLWLAGWRESEPGGRDINSLAGLLSGSITFGELLSTPVWQLHHRGWKERSWGWGSEGGRTGRKARKGVLRKPLYLPLVTRFFCA